MVRLVKLGTVAVDSSKLKATHEAASSALPSHSSRAEVTEMRSIEVCTKAARGSSTAVELSRKP